ncbi:hypothetical protein H261_11814 [Paramagnetospirillum caucaseum]|uniref:Mu-like prophage protein gp36 n=1 Tax=Paramagnetospirillum caucaseum TaxID=1244869 RepID=M3AB40_9PROT|nr:DUF1320 domain-containing protein [Paramagnetospirillum caucaseum]EME69719.1 hypothetical protein H261_11814 [Paramagnetospirillum caucaseum]
MTYATKADMIAAFGEVELIELTDRADPPADAIDDAVLSAALAAAGAEIDGYVGRVAVLPLAVVPESLRQLALAIARYRLAADQPDGRVRVDYEDAIATLERIAKGLFVLDLPPGLPEPANAGGRVQGTAAPRVFGLGGTWP